MIRRHFLRFSAAWPLLTMAQPPAGMRPTAAGLVIRQKEPENLEFPYSSLTPITPNESFYIRSHFAVPRVDAGAWRLRVEGAVERPLDLTLDDLRQLPVKKQTATLECAGNSRVFLSPAVAGVQWELGAVSNAEWTGVPLPVILDRAGLKSNAVDVVLEGADSGEIRTDPHPPGPIHFARSLPVAKARQPETLLAFQMNGSPLPISHGFPVRAVVPGWYGMASVKWLTRIRVLPVPFQGHFQTIDYAYWERQHGEPTRAPLREIAVKSAIARPAMHEVVPANGRYRVYGAAWTGESEITKVEVSTDRGQTWASARLTGQPQRYAWVLWEYDWTTPRPGAYTLMSRATDSRGRVQPAKHDYDTANYSVHHTLPIDVEVR